MVVMSVHRVTAERFFIFPFPCRVFPLLFFALFRLFSSSVVVSHVSCLMYFCGNFAQGLLVTQYLPRAPSRPHKPEPAQACSVYGRALGGRRERGRGDLGGGGRVVEVRVCWLARDGNSVIKRWDEMRFL